LHIKNQENFSGRQPIATGMLLASVAALIWSGNFIFAKTLASKVPPFSLSFYRWLMGTVVLFPFCARAFYFNWRVALQNKWLILFAAIFGVTLFNTLIYVGAHATSAMNMALIGTTLSPIISIILARIFLQETISLHKVLGILFCLSGIIFLLSKGNIYSLLHFHFNTGDLWVIAAAFCFSIYTTLVKKRPNTLSPNTFLLSVFLAGTILLYPLHLIEQTFYAPIKWNADLVFGIAYIGIGASAISFLLWNKAIGYLGAGRTALFGNLIPLFSIIEAAFFLHEKFTWVHLVSMSLVFLGILVANMDAKRLNQC